MLWGKKNIYNEEPFESESEFEGTILEVSSVLFGNERIYLDVKKKLGVKGKIRNIPDGYLIDLSSAKDPKLYIIENELAKHDPLKHIAVQILEFSLSFETTPHTVKNIIREALISNTIAASKCQEYAHKNGFENIDVLIERMIYGQDRFNALVIIDEVSEELEKVLISRFRFPVEILTLARYQSDSGERIYRFEPFLIDITAPRDTETIGIGLPALDPAEMDTIVVPARDDGFNEVFLGENRWYAIRIHSSMIPKIKYIAVYRVAPVSAITHIAPVSTIEQWKDTSKYVVNFAAPATEIGPIRLVAKGRGKAPQAPRYTSNSRLQAATTIDEVF